MGLRAHCHCLELLGHGFSRVGCFGGFLAFRILLSGDAFQA